MAESTVKTHLFDKKKDKKKTDTEEGKKTDREEEHTTPERRSIDFQVPDEEMTEKKEEHTQKQISPKRIWSKKGLATSSALYQIAATPHRALKGIEAVDSKTERRSKRDVGKETQDLLKQMQELSIHMKQQLEQLQSAGASSAEQMSNQQEAIHQQAQKLADIAQRHDDEIDDLRGMSDYTHELVMERECRENSLKMIIKAWPKEATYMDRVRVTDWPLQRANIEHQPTRHTICRNKPPVAPTNRQTTIRPTGQESHSQSHVRQRQRSCGADSPERVRRHITQLLA